MAVTGEVPITQIGVEQKGDKILSTGQQRKPFRSPSGKLAAVNGVSVGVTRGEIWPVSRSRSFHRRPHSSPHSP
jgi:hypothetical protein